MKLRGTVKNGRIMLDDPRALPEGTDVEVRPVKRTRKATRRRPKTLAERLAPFVGKAKDLPADLSVNLDHYLYGVPKKK